MSTTRASVRAAINELSRKVEDLSHVLSLQSGWEIEKILRPGAKRKIREGANLWAGAKDQPTSDTLLLYPS